MMLVAVLMLPLLVLVAQETSALLVEGQHGQARVIQVQGKNYVEVEGLTRVTGGSMRFVWNQIVLTLPGSGDTPSQAAPAPTVGLSKPFLGAGIETMREILEWHAALKTGIERGYPLSDVWFGNYRRQIQSSLKQTEAVGSTDTDQKAFPLLTNEFNNMNMLTDKYVRLSVSTVLWSTSGQRSQSVSEVLRIAPEYAAMLTFGRLARQTCAVW